ncbi:uncharacterized protein I303_103751 [Kwoniella dejecticola CBS 10117]|uniref:NmrA-like domain-containing protein n=1 Tax=Kwoniella dejecticola CBS 10117 TaxID=1296121 RepID=A0A1A6A7L7_9TREE|nr:uncharacterized protein I303_03768 [Kwoniella dejecticola CBS 10117]OBR86050.1 hypothetical protein I303_03768 [Kwoniella dejecticola CBS 10117]
MTTTSSSTGSLKVGLIGHTGNIGSALLPRLLDAHRAGQIELLILHREGSDLSKIPSTIEKRIIQLDEHGREINRAAVDGVEILISTVADPALASQTYLLDALHEADSHKKTLKTFIHSDFGVSWTPEEIRRIPKLKDLVPVKANLVNRAKDLGVPITDIRIGLLDSFFFSLKFLGTDAKSNKIELFRGALHNPIRLTTLDYLSRSVLRLITEETEALDGRTIHVFDKSPTGQELVDALTAIHGSEPAIVEYTEARFDQNSKTTETISAISTGLKFKWGENSWGEGEVYSGHGHDGESLEEIIKRYL